MVVELEILYSPIYHTNIILVYNDTIKQPEQLKTKMRYFLDTEFIERGDRSPLDLISIGIIAEDGREYYAVNKDCDYRQANEWVLENVLTPMGLGLGGIYAINPSNPGTSLAALATLKAAKTKLEIMEDLLQFFAPESITNQYQTATRAAEDCYRELEFWADYGSYDWVAFCQIFGTMIDLPNGFPMFINDIQQERRRLGYPKLPKQESGHHNALEDAKWVKKAWEYLVFLEKELLIKK